MLKSRLFSVSFELDFDLILLLLVLFELELMVFARKLLLLWFGLEFMVAVLQFECFDLYVVCVLADSWLVHFELLGNLLECELFSAYLVGLGELLLPVVDFGGNGSI